MGRLAVGCQSPLIQLRRHGGRQAVYPGPPLRPPGGHGGHRVGKGEHRLIVPVPPITALVCLSSRGFDRLVGMAQITIKGNPIHTVGELPAVGAAAPAFALTGTDLGTVSSDQFDGKTVVLNIFPSVDTPVCATSVRTFNERAAGGGATVVNVSKDLPFAQKRFCGAEGIENVTIASAFRDSFGEDYGITLADGPFAGLLGRAVVVIGADGKIAYTELVPEIAQEPDYDAALAAVK